MTLSGADLTKLLELSKKFGKDHDTLHSLVTALDSATSGSHDYWTGKFANDFRHEWASLKPSLTKFVTLLHDAQQATKTHHGNIGAATGDH
ncbi:WXG100 family type VII secretion target [Streptomyces sp. A 4/2]|uniref:WXG100 family type VII secretion target n=1 Tax=Streptomyces sp. A 4/2 TaxID=2934314 RepID=UPI002025AE89|nr:WXG100 family type VII secretion target [Streptomyces sp. A 4/2]